MLQMPQKRIHEMYGEKSDNDFRTMQVLRNASQALERRECNGASLETEVPLEFVDTQAPVLTFPLQHTEGGETAGDMMQLRPLRSRLTATEPELTLTGATKTFTPPVSQPRSAQYGWRR